MIPVNSLVLKSVCLVVIAWCVWDVILDCLGGSDWTISRSLLGLEGPHPLTSLLVCYTLSVLVGHLYIAAFRPSPPEGWMWPRTIATLAPVAWAIWRLATEVPGADSLTQLQRLFSHGIWPVFFALWATGGVGLLAGAFGVPQHPGVSP